MEALSNQLIMLWNDVVNVITSLFNTIPKNILYFGFIMGFFFSYSEFVGKKNRQTSKLLLDVRHASCSLAIIASLVGIAYLVYTANFTSLLYLFAGAIAGFLVYFLIVTVLSYIEIIGNFFEHVVALLSGPVLTVTVWFFYTGELVPLVRKLFAKLPF